MPEYIHYKGLCSTCKFSSSCMFRKDHLDSVHFCEEYEQADPSQKYGAAGFIPANPTANSFTNQSPRQIMGLCSNCKNRSNCSFPKPESGVWHCEEYM